MVNKLIPLRFVVWSIVCTTDRFFKKRGYERDDFLFRTVIKISKIQFTQFLQTSASKFSHESLPNHTLL